MKVIIAGPRSYTSGQHILWSAIEKAQQQFGFKITEVVSGKARGVDRMGEVWAANFKIPVKPFDPAWDNISSPGAVIRYYKSGPNKGKAYNAVAGHWRNQEMVDYADAAIYLWDGESKGTKDCIDRAKKKGIPIYIHRI